MLKTIAISMGTMYAGHLVLWLITRVLHWLFPFRPAPGQTRWNLQQLDRLYGKVGRIGNSYWNLGWLVMSGAACYLLLRVLAMMVYPDPGAYGLLAAPGKWMAYLAIPLGAMTAYYLLVPVFMKQRLKRRYAEYLLYRKWTFTRLAPHLDRAIAGSFALLLVLLSYVLLTTYTLFTYDRIVIQRPYRGMAEYRYSEIAEIRLASVTREREGKKPKMRRRYEIEFYDGTIWHSWKALSSTDLCRNYAFMAFAADRSGKPISGPDLHAETVCP